MKKQFTIMAMLFALVLMSGLGTNLRTVDVENPTPYSFNLIETAYAQDEVTPAPTEVVGTEAPKAEMPKLPGVGDDPASDLDTSVFLKALIDSIGSFKGASTLMVVALIVQLLMLFFRTPLGAFADKWKLMIVYVLSLVGGVLALKATVPGMEWLAALLHSNTLAAMQVTINQVKKQFWDKADEKPANA